MKVQLDTVKHLLVDLDGTLLGNRNIPLSFDFVIQALGALRKYGTWKQAMRTLLAIGNEFKKPSSNLTNDLRIVELFAKQMNLSVDEARQILRDSVSTIFPTLKRHFYPIEGAKDFLEWAKQNYPLTLATNPVWPSEIVELRVQWAGIDPAIFKSITHVRRMHACKPTRKYYEEILEQENLKSENCLLIGDNVKMDLPATAVGVRVYIVGPYRKVTPLSYSGAKAPAWKGSYSSLREILENSQLP